MSRITLESLTPNTNYLLQLRSKGSLGVSDWSRQFAFSTTVDAISPATPTGVTGAMSGTAFTITWNQVILSTDGNPATDLDTYVVKVQSSGSGNIGIFKTQALRFDFTFEMNRALFGTAQANVQMSVAAQDVVGNISPYSSIVNQTNSAPAAVTNLTVTAGIDSLLTNWTGVADADLDHYELHVGNTSGFTTSPATLVWTGLATGASYKTTSYGSTLYVKVYSVDVFGTLSTAVQAGPISPIPPFTVDITAPDVPTGLSATLATTSDQKTTATISWSAVANPTNDLQGYMVRYKASVDSDYSYMTFDSTTTTAKILLPKAYVNYDFAVRAFDFYANYSAWSSTVTATAATNTAPSTPATPTMYPGVQSMVVLWTDISDLDVVSGAGTYNVQIDTVNTFNSGNLKSITTSGTIVSFTGLLSTTLYYGRVRAIDSLGLTGPYSTIASATTGTISNGDIVAGTISGNIITAGTLNGAAVVANTLDANTLKANSIISQTLGVNTTLTLGDTTHDGILQSFGYVAGSTGFKLAKSGLEINQGVIRAPALLIQDSDNIMLPPYADFEYLPSWYTSGNMLTNQITNFLIATGTPKFNSQYISVSWGTASPNPTVYLGATNTDYNTPVDPSTTYILSAWIRNPNAIPTIVRGNVKFGNATVSQAFSVTPVTSSTAWVRYSGTITVPSGVSSLFVYFDSTTLTSGAGFDLDGVQLERQMAGSTTPSSWTPPGLTRIDGSIIRTGTIQSFNTITVNGVTQPAWSVNLTGNAQFGSAFVRGALTVGAAGADVDAGNSFIASGNYLPGTTGWKIDSSGNAEFQTGTFRGLLYATGGDFTGSIITGGTLQSGNFTLSPDPANPATFNGWQIAQDGSALFYNVGIGGTNYTIDNTGTATFSEVDVDQNITIGGSDLQLDIIDPIPNGLVAYTTLPVGGVNTANIGTTETILFQGSVGAVQDQRFYKFTLSGHVSTSSSVTTIPVDIIVRYTNDNSNPTLASTMLHQWRVNLQAANGQDFHFQKVYSPSADYDSWKFAVCMVVASGLGTAYINNSSAGRQMEYLWEDVGQQLSINNTGLTQKSKAGGGTSDPDPVSTKVKIYNSTWSTSWDNAGGSVYAQNGTLRQGTYSGAFGEGRSWIGFPRTTIQSDLASATVKKVEVYLFFWHWYNDSGGTASLGYHNSTASSAPSSYNSALDNLDELQISGWSRKAGKWVDITSHGGFTASGWKTGTHTGVTLSGNGSTSVVYYGKAYGFSQSHAPKLRITYSS